ncbi:hypothetical protein HDV06_004329 [Boothiomyces sp. JEL0866]|nr:hypothetical protein HDV06_004329 [Boothiomyces sp. JEL0866]
MENANWKKMYETLLEKIDIIEANLEEHRILSAQLSNFCDTQVSLPSRCPKDPGVNKEGKHADSTEEILSESYVNRNINAVQDELLRYKTLKDNLINLQQESSGNLIDSGKHLSSNEELHEQLAKVKVVQSLFLNISKSIINEFNFFRTQYSEQSKFYDNLNNELIRERRRNSEVLSENMSYKRKLEMLFKRCSKIQHERDTLKNEFDKIEVERNNLKVVQRLMKRMKNEFFTISSRFDDFDRLKDKLEEKTQQVVLLEQLLDKKNDEVKSKEAIIDSFKSSKQLSKAVTFNTDQLSIPNHSISCVQDSLTLNNLQSELKQCKLSRMKWKSMHLKQKEINKELHEKLDSKNQIILKLEQEVQQLNVLKIRMSEMELHWRKHHTHN